MTCITPWEDELMFLQHISHERRFTFAPTLIEDQRRTHFINKKIAIKGNYEADMA